MIYNRLLVLAVTVLATLVAMEALPLMATSDGRVASGETVEDFRQRIASERAAQCLTGITHVSLSASVPGKNLLKERVLRQKAERVLMAAGLHVSWTDFTDEKPIFSYDGELFDTPVSPPGWPQNGPVLLVSIESTGAKLDTLTMLCISVEVVDHARLERLGQGSSVIPVRTWHTRAYAPYTDNHLADVYDTAEDLVDTFAGWVRYANHRSRDVLQPPKAADRP